MIIPEGKKLQIGNRLYLPGEDAPDKAIPESWKEKKKVQKPVRERQGSEK